MFLTKPYKMPPFSRRQNWPKSNINSTSRMFDAYNTSAKSSVRVRTCERDSIITFSIVSFLSYLSFVPEWCE